MSSLGRDGAGDLKGGKAPLLPQSHGHERFSLALRSGALVCALAVLWLATRPYPGVVFDARFYLVEALRALEPQRFAQDLYFQFGSQGSFSLFTRLYSPLLRLFGVGATVILLTAAGQGLWLFGLVRLVRSLVGRQWLWLSIALTIGMLQSYPGGFGYGENQLTARLYAEAMVMLGLSLLATRPFWSAALLSLATALHPLMALPGIAVALVYLALGRPFWWAVLAAGAGLAAALGLAGVAPFSNLFRTIDPEWLAIVNVRSTYSSVGNWSMEFFVQAAAVFIWGAGALLLAGPDHRRFVTATFVVGVGGLACAFLGGDIAHNLLVAQIQPWRSIWLLQLVLHIYMPMLIAVLLSRTSFDSSRWTVFLGMGLVVCSSLARLRHATAENSNFTFFSMALVAAASAVIVAQLLPEGQKHRRIFWASALSGLALLPIALLQWDARTPWLRYLDSGEPPPKELIRLLPAGASVYWEDGLEMLWLRMRRSSYFSCDQATGVLFYRQTAMAYKRRAASFWPLRTDDFTKLDDCAISDPRPRPERNRAGLQKLCIREPGLDYVVLTAPLEAVQPVGIWNAPVQFQDLQTSHHPGAAAEPFYIYACGGVR